jgi:hypothetical protein
MVAAEAGLAKGLSARLGLGSKLRALDMSPGSWGVFYTRPNFLTWQKLPGPAQALSPNILLTNELAGSFRGKSRATPSASNDGGVMQLYNRSKMIALEAGALVLVLGLCGLAPMSRAFAAGAHHSGLRSITIPVGTTLLIRTVEPVDSERNRAGDRFSANLEADLMADGRVIAPRGATVYGKLSEVQRAGHFAGEPELKLELTDILVDDRLLPIATGAYRVAVSSRGPHTANKTVAGGAAGAAVGGRAGAAIGVGSGTVAVDQIFAEGPKVHIPSETVLEFRLRESFVINRDAD